MLEIFDLQNVDKKAWNSMLLESEHATVFHTLEWIKIQKEVLGLKERLVVLEGGIFPFFVKKKGFFSLYGSPLPETGAHYGAPLKKEYNKENMVEILKPFENLGPFTSVFLKTPNYYDPSLFKEQGYAVENVENYILELNDAEALWKNLNKKTRNAVRKAQKSGVEVEKCPPERLEEYYSMVLEVSKRNRILPLPLQFYKKVLEELPGTWMMMAFYEGKPVAGGIFLTFKDTILYWDGASYAEYRKYQPSNLIQWRLIEEACERFKYYDLGGAGIEDIKRFKRGWGGSKTEYYRVYKDGFFAGIGRSFYAKARSYPVFSRIFRA